VTVAAVVALLATAPPLGAQPQPKVAQGGAPKPAGKTTAIGTAEMVATVARVDLAKRTVTLKGWRGNIVTMDVGDGVRNLPQVKIGERVVVTYAQALALELVRKSGPGVGERVADDAAARVAPGAARREVKVVADVMVVNIRNQTVTLRGPKQAVTLKLRDPGLLKSITAGDQVEATYTEALALAVRPALNAAPR
jgi:hypothetical protein